MVGPLNVAPGQALPDDLQSFLDQQFPMAPPQVESRKPGAVFVSMGTVVLLTEAEILGMAANLAALNRPVLWKIGAAELPGDDTCTPQL